MDNQEFQLLTKNSDEHSVEVLFSSYFDDHLIFIQLNLIIYFCTIHIYLILSNIILQVLF